MHINLRSIRIVQLFGACCFESSLGIVLEYVSGGSLHSQLQKQYGSPIDWPLHLKLAKEIAAGVTYLHKHKIIHRDLKSLNILVDRKNGAKICDFGLAKIKKTAKSTMSVGEKGTTLWMAPELFERMAKYTEGSDVFGMGMIFVELCTNQTPWEEDLDSQDPRTVVPRWLDRGERPNLPQGTPTDFCALIQMMWAQDVSARPAAAVCLEQLQLMLGTARPSPPPSIPQKVMPSSTILVL
jgi:serine/threonine protein kinase